MTKGIIFLCRKVFWYLAMESVKRGNNADWVFLISRHSKPKLTVSLHLSFKLGSRGLSECHSFFCLPNCAMLTGQRYLLSVIHPLSSCIYSIKKTSQKSLQSLQVLLAHLRVDFRAFFSSAIPLIKINFFWVKLFSLAFLCTDPVGSKVFCWSNQFLLWSPALLHTIPL